MAASDKTLFEIYRGGAFDPRFHCIFYTDLEEHERERMIAKAAAGEPVFSGFVADDRKAEARSVIDAWLEELNDGDDDVNLQHVAQQAGRLLDPYLV